MTTVSHRSVFDCDVDELFTFHLDAENLGRITPPFPPFRMLSEPEHSVVGARQVFRLGFGPIGATWHAKLTRVEGRPGADRPRLLEDVQESGPFQEWRHQHQVYEREGGAILRDVVRFRFFPGPAGAFLDWLLVRPAIKGLLLYRHRATREALADQAR